MPLLAFDTASDACSAAVAEGGRIVARTRPVARGHAEILMPMIADVMAEARVSFDDLERLVVTTGPGSFTGVRVAVAAARGFALAGDLPVVGLSTLAVHAESARETHVGPVLAVLAAGRGDVYGALYDAVGREVLPPAAAPAAHFAALVTAETVLAGSAADAVAALVTGGPVTVAHRHSAVDIAALCRLGARAPEPAAPPRPLYLRPPDAKPQQGARIAHR